MSAIEIAKELIRFDTSGPPTREEPLAVWIRDFLEDLGVDASVQGLEPGRANVVGKIGKGRGLVLSGHIDEVPPGDPSRWKVTSPFEPKVVGDKLYGRGACDMKGPDACILQAVRELAKEKFRRQLSLVFTAGEDTGGWFVDRVLSERLTTPAEASFGVIGEPSMMGIVTTHKGSGGGLVTIRGKSAHSSRPDLGVNAIINASRFIQEIVALQGRLNETQWPLLGPTTIKPTLIKGGFKSNVIPDLCEVTLNVRPIPGHDKTEVVRGWVDDIIAKLSAADPNFRADVTGLRCSDALDIPEKAEVVQLLMGLLSTRPEGVAYYTEAVSYTKAGIPTVICGPGDIAQAHAPDEYVSLDQLEKGTRLYKQLIEKVCL